MRRKIGLLAVFLLLGACGRGQLAPEMPLSSERRERSANGNPASVPLQANAVDKGTPGAQDPVADAPQPTGGGFFVERMMCRYTGVGVLTRPFGCTALGADDKMMALPNSLEARFTVVDFLKLELTATVQRDLSGVWHWVGEVPNVSAVGASVRATLMHEGKSIEKEAPILEMGAP